jgi:hypothetical protein
VLFVFLALFVQAFSLKSYAGFQVIRISFNTTQQHQIILDAVEQTLADVWGSSTAEGWIDVMVPKSSALWKQFVSDVRVPDVQSVLLAHQEQNMAARSGKKMFDFDYYPETGEVRQWVAQQIARHHHAKLVKIGETHNGEEIHGVSLGDPSQRVFYMHCTIHAREWITTTSCLWILDQLLNKDVDRVKLTELYHWIIVPILNIDGYDYTHTNDRLWRKNRQPNTGSSCLGTDNNRNYAFGWGGPGASANPCAETFRGARAFSSPESKAENDYLEKFLDAGRVVAYLDIHSYGGWFLSAWGYTTSSAPVDYPAMRTQMISATTAMRAINGNTYTYGQSGQTLYVTSGSTCDHLYGEGGVIHSYTIECAGNSFTLPVSQIIPIGREVWAGVKKIATDLA